MTTDLRHRVSKPISRLAKTGALSPAEVRAARLIEAAVISILTQDIHSGGIAERGLARGNTGPGFEDQFLRRHDVRQSYYGWVEQMGANQLPAGPVLAVIIDGRALTEVDRTWKKRKGWTRGKLISGLKLFIEIESQEREKRNRLTA